MPFCPSNDQTAVNRPSAQWFHQTSGRWRKPRLIVVVVSEGAEFVEAMSSEGQRVLEAELVDERELGDLIIKARGVDAELLWLHSNLDLTAHGFERFPGYVRMRTEEPPQGQPLRRLEPEYYASTLDGSSAACGATSLSTTLSPRRRRSSSV